MSRETGECHAIFVLGMHRSGTSCLAGSLQRRGLYLGDVQESNPHNRRGNRESRRIMYLNDAVLAHSDGAWNRPPDKVSWTAEHAAERDLVIETLRGGGRTWGFKDQRTILVLPFWLEGVRSPRFVGTFRHPTRVTCSLHKRDGMPSGEAFALWHAYNRLILDHHRRQPFPLLSFDLDEADYPCAVDRVTRQLGLPGLEPGVEDFFDPDLRGGPHDPALFPEPPTAILRVHDELLEAGRKPIP